MIEKIVGFFVAKGEEERKMPKVAENARAPTLLRIQKSPVKLTALLYLKEALQRERYEECSELIRVAKEFGAQDREVEELLEDPRRMPR